MTREEHIQRHIELHKALDELLADWIRHTNGSLYDPLDGFLKWSFEQTKDPTEVPKP